MLEVAARVQKSSDDGLESYVSPLCFRVFFDAEPVVGGGGDGGFYGTQTFGLLSEVVVPMKMPLETATFANLVAEFVMRAAARYPGVSQRSVEAFFFSTDASSSFPSTKHVSHDPLLRLDVSSNAGDTLDCFFVPPVAGVLSVYNVVAHWSSNVQGNSESDRVTAMLPDRQREKEDMGHSCEEHQGFVLEESPPVSDAPSWTDNSVQTSHPLREESQKMCTEGLDPQTNSQVVATAVLSKMDDAARMARFTFEEKERSARKVAVADEYDARRTIVEVEREGRRQTVALLRLIDNYDDLVDWCDASSLDFFTLWQRYPIDTVPLAEFPSQEYKTELKKHADETAWLSHVFSKTPAVGSAALLARQKRLGRRKKRDEENENQEDVKASVEADSVDVGDGDYFSRVLFDCSEAEEKIIEHYTDVRRDLLLWERKTFRALVAEMRLILEKQKQLDAELLRTAILDELETAAVFDFNTYTLHYQHQNICTERGGIQHNERDVITNADEECVKSAPKMYKNLSTSLCKPEGPMVAADTAEAEAETTPGQMVSATSSCPYVLLSPRSLMAEDEKFRLALEERKACSKSLLETIMRIDKYCDEPVSLKFAKHRICLSEKEKRNALLMGEKVIWNEIVDCAKQERCDLEFNAILTNCRLVEPVVTAEEKDRTTIIQQQERQMSLFSSLQRCSLERSEMCLP